MWKNQSFIVRCLPDALYLQMKFKKRMGQHLNLRYPKTFNQKIQWLKLHDRKPEYTEMVDKVQAKEIVRQILGDDYLIPTLGVWKRAEDIDFSSLPERFVLKCTHDSGSVFICNDRTQFDQEKTVRKLSDSLNGNFYYVGREWPYKNVIPRVLAEPYIVDHESGSLDDYKFFCFHGKADCVMVCTERKTGTPKFYFFDRNWNLLRINVRGKEAPENFTLPKPARMDEMFEIAERLSSGIPFVRVDLYNCNEQIYFGEWTFYPDSGFDKNLLPETDLYFGDKINLMEV